MIPTMLDLMNDPYAAVRWVAFVALQKHDQFSDALFEFDESEPTRRGAVNGLLQVFKPISGPGPTVNFESLAINGAVYNNGSTVTLSNSTVTSSGGIAVRNLASACCDLLGFSAAHTTITDCVISATGTGTPPSAGPRRSASPSS